MNDKKNTRDFTIGFEKLNENNKQYILAITQALFFAQETSEKIVAKNKKVVK